MSGAPALEIDGLSVSYATSRGPLRALDDVSLAIPRGRAHGLVGESGSGKSTVVLALLGLLGEEAAVDARALRLAGEDLLGAGGDALRARRGDRMAAVFQDPGAALNPALTVGLQIGEPLMTHRGLGRQAALARAVDLLAEVGVPRPAAVAAAYPHQLSGGMKQRALIATALACEPDLLLLDEPTTALDVTVEAQILDLLEALQIRRGLSLLLVSHNLGIVDRVCGDLTVLYAGRVVEQGPTAAILEEPRHPYTKGLLGAAPRIARGRVGRLTPIPGALPDLTRPDPGCIFRPRCPFAAPGCEKPQPLRSAAGGAAVRCVRSEELAGSGFPSEPVSAAAPEIGDALLEAAGLTKSFRSGGFIRALLGATSTVRAVDGVSFSVRRGEVLGLVGESGCGKTTLGRLALRLLGADGGTLRFAGEPVAERPSPEFRRRAQIVFQNPDSSLNPRKTVAQILRRPLELFGEAGATERRLDELLALVRLGPAYRDRYPHQLSGGEKQRVGIARALATGPDFIVCDEAVSALDVSVQAAILNLLAELRDRLGVAYLFISHDISVIAHVADRIAVMYRGAIVEEGPAAEVLRRPYHPYTEALLSAVPVVGARGRSKSRIRLLGDASTPAGEGGCRFAHRCPRRLGEICERVEPPVVAAAPGHLIACHIPIEELARAAAAFAPKETGTRVLEMREEDEGD